MSRRAGDLPLALRVALFTLFVPGTAAGLAPWWLARGRLHRPLWEWDGSGPFERTLAALLAAAGALLYVLCAIEFARRGRGTPAPFDAPQSLVQSGLYRHLRNPMYVAIVALLTAEALAWRSVPVAIYAGCLALGFHLRVVFFEEPALRRAFGADFDRYCASVPRWLPRPLRRETAP